MRSLRSLPRSEGGLILLDQGILSFTNFVTNLLLLRSVRADGGPEDDVRYASYLLAFNVLQAFLTIHNSFVSVPVVVFLPGEFRDRPGAYLRRVRDLLLGTCAALAAGCLLVAAARARGSPGIAAALAVLALSQVPFLGRELARRSFFAMRRPAAALRADAVASAAQLLGALGLCAAGIATGASFIGLLGLAAALGALVSPLPAPAPGEPGVSLREAFWRHAALGRWLVPGDLCLAGALLVYPWLLERLRGPAGPSEVTRFGAAQLAVLIANPLLLALASWASPRASHARAAGGTEGLHRETLRIARLAGAATAAFAAVLLAFPGEIVAILAGGSARFAGLDGVVRILAAGLLLQGLAMPARMGLNLLERGDLSFFASLLALAVTGFAGVLLVRGRGVAGAALGLLAANGASLIGFWAGYAMALRRARSRPAAAAAGEAGR